MRRACLITAKASGVRSVCLTHRPNPGGLRGSRQAPPEQVGTARVRLTPCLWGLGLAATLNNRPREVLGWKTPAEAFNGHLLSLQEAGVATIT